MTPAPQLTPEIREAMRTLAALLGCAAEPDREAATCYAAVVQAALDRAQQRLDDVLRGQRALQDQTVRIRRALGVPEGAKGDTEDYARELLRQVRDMQKLLASRESPVGAAPPEPDFTEARQALARLSCFAPGTHNDNPATCPACNGNDSQTIRATLDQAESEIARLREENAAARCEALALFNAMDHGPAEPLDTVAGIISQISNMVAGLRGTAPGDSKPTESWCYGEVIRRLVPSVSPSVPKEEDKP